MNEDLLQYELGLFEKLSSAGEYAKDFLGGIDPFGNFTSTYAAEAQRSGASEGKHQKKQWLSTAGGLLGGATVVPAGIFGLIGLASKGKFTGFGKPFRDLATGINARKALRNVQASGGQFDEKSRAAVDKLLSNQGSASGDFLRTQADQLRRVANQGSDLLSSNLTYVKPIDASRLFKELPVKTRQQALQALHSDVNRATRMGMAQLGMGGAIGAGGAYLQYNKGRELERQARKRYSF